MVLDENIWRIEQGGFHLRDHSLFMARGGYVGGGSKIGSLRGGCHRKYANRLGGGHLLLNNLSSDMFIKTNIYYKKINTNSSNGIEKTMSQQSTPIEIVEQEEQPTDTLILFFYTCCKFCCYVYM